MGLGCILGFALWLLTVLLALCFGRTPGWPISPWQNHGHLKQRPTVLVRVNVGHKASQTTFPQV
ncbi:hypothetical protein BDW22DRAFT_1360312 [Trametopsis cervina]|nr:hypothetical protein BDW22DRAFT_1360312 [Trametopsis cervina]